MKLKLGTYNILHGKNYGYFLKTGKSTYELDEVARILLDNEVEICAFNEVLNEGKRGVGDQAARLGELTGYRYLFAKAIDRPNDSTYGNALLSKYPIISSRTVSISLPKEDRNRVGGFYEDRVLLIADIDVVGRTLTVMVSHFGCVVEERSLAIATVKREMEKIKNPVVFMGDLNITPDSSEYDTLTESLPRLTDTAALMGDKMSPNTFLSDRPFAKIDYIMIDKDMTVTETVTPDSMQSDHKPYFATIEW